MKISALLAPLLPEAVRYDDRVRAGVIYLIAKLEQLTGGER